MSLMQGRYAGLNIVHGFQKRITVNVDVACQHSLYIALYTEHYEITIAPSEARDSGENSDDTLL